MISIYQKKKKNDKNLLRQMKIYRGRRVEKWGGSKTDRCKINERVNYI